MILFLSGPGSAQSVDLTPEERAYLQTHDPVTLCVDPEWPPFEVINGEGVHEGIAADLLRLAAERVGLRLRLIPTGSWDESLEASQKKQCTLLSFLNQSPKRDEWLIFTDPLFTDVNVFITREEHPFIVDPASLDNATIVFPRGTAMEERIRKNYPNLKILLVAEEKDAIRMVSERTASMTMRSLIVAAYTIRKEGLFNLKIAGQLPAYENRLRVGVLKTEPVLRDILNKGIASITPLERGQIVNRHVTITIKTGIDYLLIMQIAGIFAVILLAGLFWAYRLKQLNRALLIQSHTDTLTSLSNRTHLNLELAQAMSRARCAGRPLAVILLDIDYFKKINDTHGHLMGDQVLIAVAGILRTLVRQDDCAGRWGGEEFLIICPETTLSQAVALAERLRKAMVAHVFANGQSYTLSAGVASFTAADSSDSLLHRADIALYEAKAGGRNRVCSLAADPAGPDKIPCNGTGRVANPTGSVEGLLPQLAPGNGNSL